MMDQLSNQRVHDDNLAHEQESFQPLKTDDSMSQQLLEAQDIIPGQQLQTHKPKYNQAQSQKSKHSYYKQQSIQSHQFYSLKSSHVATHEIGQLAQIKNKKLIFILLCVMNFLTTSTYYVIAPFYPPLAKQRGMSQIEIGSIFSVECLSTFGLSLVIGKMIAFWGRKKLFIQANIMMIVGLLMFGCLNWIQGTTIFISLSILSRLIQGVGAVASAQIIYAKTSLLYQPHEVSKYLGICEIIGQLGGALAPAMGSATYSLGGYAAPFIFISSIMAINLILLVKLFPKDKVLKREETPPLKLRKMLGNLKIMWICILVCLAAFAFTFIDPTLSIFLNETYGENNTQIGLIFVLFSGGYMLPLVIIIFMPSHISNQWYLAFGLMILSLSLFIIGPDMLIFPSKLYITCIGIFLLGFGVGFVYMPSIPELINVGMEIFPEQDDLVKDMASGVWISSFSLGTLLGPLMASIIVAQYSFRFFVRWFGIATAFYFVLYMSFGNGSAIFRTEELLVNSMLLMNNEQEIPKLQENLLVHSCTTQVQQNKDAQDNSCHI